MQLIIMMGTTCAGKTTHGKLIAEAFRYRYVSSGVIARNMMDADTARSFTGGGLSPYDDYICGAIESVVCSGMNGIVLDGFPRIKKHYDKLKEWMRKDVAPPVIIYFDITRELVQARATARKRDEFDAKDATDGRNTLFIKETLPLLKDMVELAGWPMLNLRIRSERPVEQVQAFIRGMLKRPRAVGTVIDATI